MGILVLACVLSAWWWFDSAPAPGLLPPILEAGNGVEPLSLKLLRAPHISRGGSPAFPIGEKSYTYNGTMEIDGRKHRLSSESYAPIAALRFQGEVYLLLRAYFWEEYHFRKLSVDERFKDAPFSELPSAFRFLQFKSKEDAYPFRVWYLRSLARAEHVENTSGERNPRFILRSLASDEQVQEAVRCFCAYTDEDSRWVFPAEKSGTELEEYLEAIWHESRFSGMTGGLKQILDAARPNDHPQIIRFVCLALDNLSPTAGREFLLQFQARVLADHTGVHDYRRDALEMVLGRNPLTAPVAASQPTTQP